jgi:hypothetical protein
MRAALLGLLCLAVPAWAGPPFLTDDPVPVDLHHWEAYGFSAMSHVSGDTGGTQFGTEINYGAAPDLQLHIIVPLAYDRPQGGPAVAGLGDIELGAKYRLVDRSEGDWWPQIGVFPLIELPAGNARRGLGAGVSREYLPVWLQWDVGKWTAYGGGGYWINPGAGNRNYWFAGWLLQYQVTDDFAFGGEVFHQTASSFAGRDTTGFNLGGVFDFTDHYHLLFSAGRGLQDAAASNEFTTYAAIQWTGP